MIAPERGILFQGQSQKDYLQNFAKWRPIKPTALGANEQKPKPFSAAELGVATGVSFNATAFPTYVKLVMPSRVEIAMFAKDVSQFYSHIAISFVAPKALIRHNNTVFHKL